MMAERPGAELRMNAATEAAPALREPELAGQTVVVVGGSAGIGFETARRAGAEGAKVILTARDPGRLSQAARDVGLRAPRPLTPRTLRP
jgi:S-adenosylhomocysteine hydrolase